MKIQPGTKLLNTKELASKLHIHPKLVIRWINNLSLPCYRFAKEYRFNETEVEEWIEAHRHQSDFDAKRFMEPAIRNRKK